LNKGYNYKLKMVSPIENKKSMKTHGQEIAGNRKCATLNSQIVNRFGLFS